VARERITSTANPAVKAARRLGRSGRARAGGAFLVEGEHAVAAAGNALVRLFATGAALDQHGGLVRDALRRGVELVEVSEEVIATVATTVTPQGLVGVAALPARGLDEALEQGSLVLVLDEIRDPGNVGTIIRTADAAGADAVVLTEGSAEARGPKAVRSSAGSLFAVPVVEQVALDAALGACRAHGLQVLGTSPRGDVDCDAADLTRPTALLFGGEARGLPDRVLHDCDAVVRIPLSGRAESLNLAASVAILTYEAGRQRRARMELA
jgi:TrmH family RNA methyltransferase